MSKEISFEEAISKLRDIVDKLEAGEETLDKSIELFKVGSKLASECEEKLKKAEVQIQELS